MQRSINLSVKFSVLNYICLIGDPLPLLTVSVIHAQVHSSVLPRIQSCRTPTTSKERSCVEKIKGTLF